MTDGIVLINKTKDWTSRDVVNKACEILDTRKIGHCGTLDPFATGILILGVNKGTKILQFLENGKKKYVAQLKLGKTTDTLDVTGTVTETKEVPYHTPKEIIEVLKSFVGRSLQKTPRYSARKVKGKKLYEYAREGIPIDDVYKEIEIYSINLITFSKDEILFMAEVSKGTYIRQLASDIAEKLGTVGMLIDLERLSIGNYTMQDAIPIEELSYDKLIDYNKALDFMPTVRVSADTLKSVKNGTKVKLMTGMDRVLVKDYDNNNIAVYEKCEDGYYRCQRGL